MHEAIAGVLAALVAMLFGASAVWLMLLEQQDREHE